MAEFDPYRKWLGIPPEEQPPNHYRLLGIGLFEVDADVISNAADRQMVHVRGYQSGKYSAESQQILNELAAARVCLLDSQRKDEYDRYLRETLAAREPVAARPGAAAPPPPQPPPPPPPAMVGAMAMAPPAAPLIETDMSTAAPAAGTTNGHATRRKKSPLGFTLAGVAVVLTLLLGFWAFSGDGQSSRTRTPGDGLSSAATASVDSASVDNEANDDRQEPLPSESGASDLGHQVSRGDQHARLSVPRRPMTDGVGQIRAFDGHTGAVRDVRFVPGGEFILSGGDDKTVRLWDIDSGADRRFEGAINPILAVAFADNGPKIVAASVPAADLNGATLHVWPLAGGAEVARIPLDDTKTVSGIELSADGCLLVLGDANGNVRLYDLSKEKLVKQYAGHTGAVLAVDISRDGDRIVSGGEDGTIRVWQRNADKEVQQLVGHKGPVLDVVLLPSETEVLSAGADNTLRRWDIQSGKQLKKYVGHRRAVTSVDVTDDGRFAISASVDSTVRLWELATAEEFYRFGKHRGPVYRARFAEGGRRAVSAGSDGTVRLWGLPEFSQPETVARQDVPEDQPPVEVEPARAAIPDVAAQRKAEQTIRDEVFRDDFASALRPEQQLALARKLLDEGRKPQEDPALVYVLLRLAWNAATRLGESEIALAAVDEIVERYDVDAVAAKVKTMVGIAKTPGASARKRTQVGVMLRVLDEAVAADNYAAADALVDQFDPLLIKVRDGALSKQVKARVEEVGAMKQAYQGVAAAGQVLRTTPEDPAANETVGRYETLVKGNWETGLPKLAVAADPTLKQLAQSELTPPEDTAARLAVADGWWQLADALDATSQRQVKQHAATWYEQVVEQLQGVERAKVEGRLASLDGMGLSAEAVELPKVAGFNSRDAATKAALLKALGGNETSEKAVDRALKWFVGQQHPVYGSWNFTRAGADSGTLEDAPNASTALALLPFLAAGHTARRGEYKDTVGKGLRFLGSRMVPLGPNAATLYEAGASRMPSHALGTIVLCEAVGLNPDKQMRKVAQVAVNYIVGSQAADGGWGNRPSPPERAPDSSNVMATAWNVAALKAAEAAGMQVPRRSLQLAASYLDKLKSPDGQGFRYDETRPRTRPETTAAGMFARMYLGWPDDQKELVDYRRTIAAAGPHTQGGLLSNFFESEVMHQMRGPTWPGYNAALRDYLINLQSVQGATDGSWYIEDSDRMSRDGGRLLSTALATLILEVYYRQSPLYP